MTRPTHAIIGHVADGGAVTIDLELLVNTRLLIQANSGAGKSWCLRRLLEQTHGQIQHIVIDPEGEFASLREKFDYVLAAKTGGDTLAEPRTAKLLAERLLELGVSAVLDIYELSPQARIDFVQIFLEALVDAPKHLWHPALIVLDEAHVYAPEQGDAESADAVKALATRGRKRGFCLVAATQRLSKLHKDVAAECNNKLIGRSSLDVDMKRAGDELGLQTKADRLALRDLDGGVFFAFGPALTRSVTQITVGPVLTTHPKAGSHLAAVVPPPTDKVLKILAKLADLPKEAERKTATEQELRQQLAAAKGEIKRLSGGSTPAPAANVISAKTTPVLTDADRELLKSLRDEFLIFSENIAAKADLTLESIAERAKAEIDRACGQWVADVEKRRVLFLERLEQVRVQRVLDKIDHFTPSVNPGRPEVQRFVVKPTPPPPGWIPIITDHSKTAAAGGLGRAERAILAAAISRAPKTSSRAQLSVLSGYSRTSSSFTNAVGRLRTLGYLEGASDVNGPTQAGIDALGPVPALPRGQALIEHWKGQLGKAEATMLDVITRADGLDRAALAQRSGYSETSSSFTNAVGKLRTLELVTRGWPVRASEELFA